MRVRRCSCGRRLGFPDLPARCRRPPRWRTWWEGVTATSTCGRRRHPIPWCLPQTPRASVLPEAWSPQRPPRCRGTPPLSFRPRQVRARRREHRRRFPRRHEALRAPGRRGPRLRQHPVRCPAVEVRRGRPVWRHPARGHPPRGLRPPCRCPPACTRRGASFPPVRMWASGHRNPVAARAPAR